MEVWNLEDLAPPVHQPEVLRSDDGATRVIALTLPRGEQLQEHQVHEHAWLLLLDGQLKVRSGDSASDIRAGSLAHFEPAERHEVTAEADARLLLLLSPWPGPGHPNLANSI